MPPLITREEALRLGAIAGPGITVSLWDPSAQLRSRKKTSVPPRPDGSPNRGLDRSAA